MSSFFIKPPIYNHITLTTREESNFPEAIRTQSCKIKYFNCMASRLLSAFPLILISMPFLSSLDHQVKIAQGRIYVFLYVQLSTSEHCWTFNSILTLFSPSAACVSPVCCPPLQSITLHSYISSADVHTHLNK